MPFPRNHFKGIFRIRLCGFLSLSHFAGINTAGNQLSRVFPPFPCIGKGYFRIGAERNRLAFAIKQVLESPPFPPLRGNQQEKPLAVSVCRQVCFFQLPLPTVLSLSLPRRTPFRLNQLLGVTLGVTLLHLKQPDFTKWWWVRRPGAKQSLPSTSPVSC